MITPKIELQKLHADLNQHMIKCKAEFTEEMRNIYGYWKSHPQHPMADWKAEIANNETRCGYWEWVFNREQEG